MKRTIAIGLGVCGMIEYFAPGWNGIFRDAAAMSAGEARIEAAILSVGAVILWFMPEPPTA